MLKELIELQRKLLSEVQRCDNTVEEMGGIGQRNLFIGESLAFKLAYEWLTLIINQSPAGVGLLLGNVNEGGTKWKKN